MPSRPSQLCSRSGCCGIVTAGVCDRCGPKRRIDNRLPARQRGYTSQWDGISQAYRQRNPLCERCKASGIVRLAELVHHIDRVSDGNPAIVGDDKLMSLCRECHAIIEAPKGGGRSTP